MNKNIIKLLTISSFDDILLLSSIDDIYKEKERNKMTLEKLRRIIEHLPADTVLLIDSATGDCGEVETITTEYHGNGIAHLILSDKE